MSEDENTSPGGIVKQTIDSVTGLAMAVPIYEDALQPLAKEAGKALGTVGKAVNLALEPLAGLVWGYDQIKKFVQETVAEKLEGVPPEQIQSPNPSVAGPALEALKYNGHDPDLREMYANLLTTSLDSKTAREAHPGFVEILKSMSPDEARVLRIFVAGQSKPLLDIQLHMKDDGYGVLHQNVSLIGTEAGCAYPDLTPSYLDNLCRLGLLEIDNMARLKDDKVYETIETAPSVKLLKEHYEKQDGLKIYLKRKKIDVTHLGRQFANACIFDKRVKEPRAQPGAAPNGGPATRVGNSGAGEGPPSVS
ncbi:MAG: DUF4393 domain-containing protein [Verrucomicrobiae bacterium]|nr:DUF4393 domain-containing protein [Verrucomicrobiae bacterium]